MYLEFVILAQILPMANPPPGFDLDKHDYKDNEFSIFMSLYNTQNGLYRGFTKKLGYITLRDNADESFYSYGFDKQNSKVLFCTTKQPMPNIFLVYSFQKIFSLFDESKSGKFKVFKNVYVFAINFGS